MSVSRWLAALLAGVLVTALTSPPAGAASQYGPQLPDNPYDGPAGTASMHGDSGASDTTALPGPGTRRVVAQPIGLAAACPTILIGADGLPVALCTQILGRTPRVYLLDKSSGTPLTSMAVAAGSLLGGVYAYLDHNDRLVLVDGDANLIRVAHIRNKLGLWSLSIVESTPLGAGLPSGDSVTSIAPAYNGKVWYATAGGTVGIIDTTTRKVTSVALPDGERVANSIATAPQGTAVVTTHALYLLTEDSTGNPVVKYRVRYDRGSARKPGQLSWGSGSTPTFFGPVTGGEYLTLIDNADNQVHLLVVSTASGAVLCTTPVLTSGGPGSENSPIGAGRTVIAASTYGYPYPAVPDDAGPAVPATAPFIGGMTRVDVRPDNSGCDVAWTNTVRSAAVPKLSVADGTIVTVTRHNPVNDQLGTTPADKFFYAAVDPGTGAVLTEQLIGATTASDPIQTAGTTAPGGTIYQGTVTGIQRITPLT
jgi:hypothetical protein